MSLPIRKNLVPENKYNIKCPYSMIPEFIVVHNTFNDASAANEIAYMIRNNNQTSFHYAIDDKEIVQGLPENRNGWHAGDGNGKGNRKGIGIEICYSKSGGERFIKAEKLAAKFIASKLKEKGWGIDKVKKHQDFSGKYCPHRTLDMGWKRFLDMVQKELDTLNKQKEKTKTENKKETVSTKTNTSSSSKTNSATYVVGNKFEVTTSINGYISADDAKNGKNRKTTVKKGTYYIYKVYNGMLNVTTDKTAKIAGSWINPADNKATSSNSSSSTTTKTYKNGDKVTLKKTATKYATGEAIANTYKGKKYTIQQVKSDRVLLKELYSWVYIKDIE